MVYKSVVVASILSGLLAGTADAGCFGNRNNGCQSAAVVCNPCTPVVCPPVVYAPPVCDTSVGMQGVGHEGPAFSGRSPCAPLGLDSQGDVITQVFPLTAPRVVSSSGYDVQRFLKDLLSKDANLALPPNVSKADILKGDVNSSVLQQILDNSYKLN